VPIIAFGGAGPVHACGVAELVEAPRVIFPANASVLSAFGILVTPARIDLVRTLVRPLREVTAAERDTVLEELREEGRRVLLQGGARRSEVRFRHGVDARYQGQGNEITVWLDEGEAWPATPPELEDRFSHDYEEVYGMTIPNVGIEIVNWRVSAFTSEPQVQLAPSGANPSETPKSRRMVRFFRSHEPIDTPVFDRDRLAPRRILEGPALIEERETTCVIPPGWRAAVDADGSLVATRIGR
jgi:N-methylhydantoinase A